MSSWARVATVVRCVLQVMTTLWVTVRVGLLGILVAWVLFPSCNKSPQATLNAVLQFYELDLTLKVLDGLPFVLTKVEFLDDLAFQNPGEVEVVHYLHQVADHRAGVIFPAESHGTPPIRVYARRLVLSIFYALVYLVSTLVWSL